MEPRRRTIWPPNAEAGFHGPAVPIGSHRLTRAVAASLALSALSLCLVVALTLASARLALALPG
ncbi:MAG: hypothetical protein DCC74_08110 [Proteobacteria bacterium]|nr:MAG: hypothetical protein DCC74_08110 [Pseudomonadota bacterium]